MGQTHGSVLRGAPPLSVLQGHTLQFQDGHTWETQRFYDRNMMHISLGGQTTVGTYTSRQAPGGDIVYHYIPVGRDGVYTGRISQRRGGQLRLDLRSELRDLRGAPCYLHA